jgi:RNA polymerase sigma factor (sigma-70 family)
MEQGGWILAIECTATVVKQIAVLFRTGTAAGLTDGSLLERFRDPSAEDAEAAFAVLVERHGPMVQTICRRIIGDRHDAEDASQAVFLVLARQARSIRRTESVASWLYGVATRVASRARLDAARRRLRERRAAILKTATHEADNSELDAAAIWPELYQELGRLPDRFLRPLLLCHLEGLTYQQAAERLGCPVRTVQSRLTRGRKRLRDRLARRGLAPLAALLTAALAPQAGAAATSQQWTHMTITAALDYAAGGTAAVVIPRAVAVLAFGASRTMNLHRLMKRAAALLLFGIAAAGGVGMSMLARSAPPEALERALSALDDNPYRATLNDGVTIEVIGVSTVPTGPNTWWKPDGSPLASAPVDTIERKSRARGDENARVILLRASGFKHGELFRWLPTGFQSSWGGRPAEGGKPSRDLEYYEATFAPDRAACDVRARVATGAWKTEVVNDGRGGVGTFVNGHKFAFGKARPSGKNGREMTVFAVAHNFFEQDRRLVAIDRAGRVHPAVAYSGASDGDKKWVIDLIDGEFDLAPDQIKEFQVQFRPIEQTLIKDIALNPRSTAKPAAKAVTPQQEARPRTALNLSDPDADSDGDGLTDFQEVHKYGTDPKKFSTAGDGVPDGDQSRRREFAYSIRSVVKVMPPVNALCLNDDYQDAWVVSRGKNFIELEVIHYPLNTNATSIKSNPEWRRDAAKKEEYLRAGITTNWDLAMRTELISALESHGIDPKQQGDKELVARASAWLFDNSNYVNMFCTHYMHYPNGRAAIYPGLEARFDMEKGDRAWTVQEQLDRELYGRSMFALRTHGSCTSSAVFLTTALRALGIPTRMVLCIPATDGNDPEQLDMVRKNIKHHQVRRKLLQGLSSAKGYANHTFNEVWVGGRWVRLNYKTLGQNILDGNLMGLLTHVNTFNDLSEVPLAATWGRRYATGERDEIFRYGNPYRCDQISDHFGKFAKIENPEVREHRSLTVSSAYWADDPAAAATIKESKWLFHNDGSRSLLIHGEEWFEDETGPQYRPFLESAGKKFVFEADNHPPVHGRITTSSITWHSRNLHKIEILLPREEYAKMQPGVEYTLTPKNEIAGYQWKIKGRVTIMKQR